MTASCAQTPSPQQDGSASGSREKERGLRQYAEDGVRFSPRGPGVGMRGSGVLVFFWGGASVAVAPPDFGTRSPLPTPTRAGLLGFELLLLLLRGRGRAFAVY
jgi:hypothetical protein